MMAEMARGQLSMHQQFIKSQCTSKTTADFAILHADVAIEPKRQQG